jgi:4-nitrophenyl phosphatase
MPVKAVIFDLDGVLYRGEQAMPGAVDVVARLRGAGIRVLYATNNSTRTRQEYVQRLRGFGFDCDIEDVITSAWATARYLLQKRLQARDPLVVGMDGLRQELRDAGLLEREYAVPRPFTRASGPPADLVVVGLHQTVTYDDLAEAQRALNAGAPFIAANKDPAYPVEGGRLQPGAGAIVAALETATGRVAVCVGKPEPFMFQEALRRAGAAGAEAIVVGDSLQTDVLAAHRVGATGVLITTGVTSEAAASSGDGVRADAVIGSLDQLLKLPMLASR